MKKELEAEYIDLCHEVLVLNFSKQDALEHRDELLHQISYEILQGAEIIPLK